MIKRLLIIFSVLLVLNSCTETIEPEYNNLLDPKNSKYLPTAPVITSHIFSPSGFTINWTDLSYGEVAFEIERSDSTNNNFKKVGTVSADSTSFFDEFLMDINVNYFYRIKVIGKSGFSAYSTEKKYIVDFYRGPTALFVTHLSNSSVKLTWLDRSILEEGFTIQMREPKIPGSVFETIGNVGKDVTQFQVNNLETNEIYEFRVIAFYSGYQIESDTTITIIFGLAGKNTPGFSSNSNTPIDFSPVLNLLAVGASENEKIKIFNYDTQSLTVTNFNERSVKFSPDGAHLAVLSNNSGSSNFVKIININSMHVEKTLPFNASEFAFSSDGTKMILSSESESRFRLIDLNTLSIIWEIPSAGFKNPGFNNQGDKILCIDDAYRILFINISDGTVYNSVQPQNPYVYDFIIDKNDMLLFITAPSNQSSQSGPLEVWDLQNLTLRKVLDTGSHLTLSPDNRFIALSTNNDVVIYRLSDFEKIGSNITGLSIKSMCFNYQSSLLGANFSFIPSKIVKLENEWVICQ